MKAYLDIETSFQGEITIIGIYHPPSRFVQLVGDEITSTNLLNALDPASIIVTYNGSRFDLPVIHRKLGLDLRKFYHCHDLMYDCWKKNLYGGLKKVEEKLGIKRYLKGLDGYDAMRLWEEYTMMGDRMALHILLKYNREDVVNLFSLEEALRFRPKTSDEI
ncbi:MAG: ribonuclease H-like domain-containing protein [Candidatus Bathyarchaeia archaeon]